MTTINSTTLKKRIPWILNVFLFISIFYFFSGIFFGLDFNDGFYHLNQALNPAGRIYSYPSLLSAFIIKFIVKIFGHKIIYLRLINSLILFFSLLVPFFFIRIEKPRKDIYFYIACVLILYAPFNYNILGYDSFSIFILSFIFTLTILYLKRAKLFLLILLTFFCSAAVLIRLPNLLVIPIIILAIGFNEKMRKGFFSAKDIKFSIIFLFLSLLWIFLGFFIYYSGIEEFFSATANSNSHNLKILFYNYFQHGIKLLLFILFILSTNYLFEKFQNKTSKLLMYFFLLFFFILFIVSFVILSPYSQNYSLFLTSLTISILISQVLPHKKNRFSLKQIVIYLYLLFLFINPFGSDTGLLKAVYLFLLLPFVLSTIDLKLKRNWLLILIILLPFSLIAKYYGSYEDSNILSLDTSLELKLLKPIKTTKTRANFLKNIDNEIISLKKNNTNIYFYGDKSHIFHYMYPGTSFNINSFYQPVDELVYYPKIEQVIKGKYRTAIFIMDSYPGNSFRDLSVVEQSLINDGFNLVDNGPIKYFFKN